VLLASSDVAGDGIVEEGPLNDSRSKMRLTSLNCSELFKVHEMSIVEDRFEKLPLAGSVNVNPMTDEAVVMSSAVPKE
jgi:hypothetical protein